MFLNVGSLIKHCKYRTQDVLRHWCFPLVPVIEGIYDAVRERKHAHHYFVLVSIPETVVHAAQESGFSKPGL